MHVCMGMFTCGSKASAGTDVFVNPSLIPRGATHVISRKSLLDIRESNMTVVYVSALVLVMWKLSQGVRKQIV